MINGLRHLTKEEMESGVRECLEIAAEGVNISCRLGVRFPVKHQQKTLRPPGKSLADGVKSRGLPLRRFKRLSWQ